MKKFIQILCFFAITQFALAQSNAENLINKMMDEYRQDPAAVFKKYAPDNYVFITAEGNFWDKTRAIQAVSSAKLEEFSLSDKKYTTLGNVVVMTGINRSKWNLRGMIINYTDAFTYLFQLTGDQVQWLSGQHSLVTPKGRNKAIYRELNQAANEGKIDYAKYYAESHENSGFGKGPKAAEAHANSFKKTFPDLQVRIIELIAEGDLVMARCEATGTQKGEMMGISATNKAIKTAHWTINRFNAEGKITESWNLNDNLSVMQQLGVLK